jgi:hypothetical protein
MKRFSGHEKLTFINTMRPNVHGDYTVALDEKHRAQIAFNVHRVNRMAMQGGAAMNFVGPQARVERIFLENFPDTPCESFWLGLNS